MMIGEIRQKNLRIIFLTSRLKQILIAYYTIAQILLSKQAFKQLIMTKAFGNQVVGNVIQKRLITMQVQIMT